MYLRGEMREDRTAGSRRNYPEAMPNGEGRNGSNARKLTRTGLTSTGATVVGKKRAEIASLS